jgi:asparagine N-glycosylation enzyme membrane subunit Stt3
MLTSTRKLLQENIHLLIPNADTNQIASAVGTVGETLVCNYFNWENIDGDGYDAIDHLGNKYEIKTMSDETKTPYIAYDHEMKKNRYDYLVILYFDLKKLSIIPRHKVNYHIKNATKSLRLDFNQTLYTKKNLLRKSMRFQFLFNKYEVKEFTF